MFTNLSAYISELMSSVVSTLEEYINTLIASISVALENIPSQIFSWIEQIEMVISDVQTFISEQLMPRILDIFTMVSEVWVKLTNPATFGDFLLKSIEAEW